MLLLRLLLLFISVRWSSPCLSYNDIIMVITTMIVRWATRRWFRAPRNCYAYIIIIMTAAERLLERCGYYGVWTKTSHCQFGSFVWIIILYDICHELYLLDIVIKQKCIICLSQFLGISWYSSTDVRGYALRNIIIKKKN